MLGVQLEDVKVSDTLKEQIKENTVISSPEKNKQALGGSSTQGNSGGASAQQSQPATQKATSAPKPPTTQPATQKPTSAPKPPATQPPTQNAEWWPSRAEIDQIIAECRSYGESIGMIWAETANKDNASWDSPEEVRWYRRLGKEKFVQTLKEFLEIDYNAGFCLSLIHILGRLHAVFLADFFFIIHCHLRAAHFGGGETNGNAVVNQLEGITVACGDNAPIPLFAAYAGKRAEDIVRLIALLFEDVAAHQAQKLLEKRKLGSKLGRHALAVGFVALVFPVAESGGGEVKRDGYHIRLRFLLQTVQDI